jgi:hypothetical protein
MPAIRRCWNYRFSGHFLSFLFAFEKCQKEDNGMDLLFTVIILLFFILGIGYVKFCEKI